MKDKGYEHPLFSLDLHTGPEESEKGRHQILVPQGRLIVSPSLLRRARSTTTPACLGAVRAGLALHRVALPRFHRHGLCEEWAQNMDHWAQRMATQEGLRIEHATSSRHRLEMVRPQLRRGRELWHAVVVSSQLAGIRGVLTQGGVAPKEVPSLSRAMTQLLERISPPGPRALLVEHGFDTSLYEEMVSINQALADAVALRVKARDEQQQIVGSLLVMRGALLGELSRLGKIATVALPRSEAALLQMQRLLPPWRRNSKAALLGKACSL